MVVLWVHVLNTKKKNINKFAVGESETTLNGIMHGNDESSK